jgi:agmatinase
MGLPPRLSGFTKSKFAILPVPYEQTTSFKGGTKDGPLSIINASRQVEFFDEEQGREFVQAGIHTLPDLDVTALGPQKMSEIVAAEVQKLLKAKKFVIMLGGEHSISFGSVKAHRRKYPKLSVLQLDAHADLRQSYQGNRFSHACVMRRVAEICPTVGYGIRNLSLEEHNWLKKSKSKIILARDLKSGKTDPSSALEYLTDDVYLTIDMDFFDPSLVPGVGTPEPGGFMWEEALDFLRIVIEQKNVVGLDLVELSPVPPQVNSEFLAAKLIYKLIGYLTTAS